MLHIELELKKNEKNVNSIQVCVLTFPDPVILW